MGDIIEITTEGRHPTPFYRVTSSAIGFEVKAHNHAVVGLTNEPGNTCQYWFGFGQGGKLWIKGPDGVKTSQGGNYTLSLNQFKRFWISWDCGVLKVGHGRDGSYIVSHPTSTAGLNYVAFTTDGSRHVATWKVELPPAALISYQNKLPPKKIEGGDLRWAFSEDALPDDAVIGGFEGECLYIIRANHRGSLTPGKFVPSEGVAYVSWGGIANETSAFEILCGYNYIWKSTKDDKIPANAFVAGFSEAHHEKLYIGRVNHLNNVIPGKVQPSHKVCYVALSDRELPFKSYEILTVPDLNAHAARPNMEPDLDSSVMRHIANNEQIFFMGHEHDDDDDDDDLSENGDDEWA